MRHGHVLVVFVVPRHGCNVPIGTPRPTNLSLTHSKDGPVHNLGQLPGGPPTLAYYLCRDRGRERIPQMRCASVAVRLRRTSFGDPSPSRSAQYLLCPYWVPVPGPGPGVGVGLSPCCGRGRMKARIPRRYFLRTLTRSHTTLTFAGELAKTLGWAGVLPSLSARASSE